MARALVLHTGRQGSSPCVSTTKLNNYESIRSRSDPANAPQNYKTECQIFLDKKEAEGYKKAKEEEYPIRWGGEYNHCEIFKKHL